MKEDENNYWENQLQIIKKWDSDMSSITNTFLF